VSLVRRFDVRVDISDAVPFSEAQIAATVVAPSAPHSGVLAVCFPGGGYSRGYWDLDWAGGYSEAEFHAERGWTVVAIDHLGVGDSSLPDGSLLTIEALSAANDAAVRRIRAGLRDGSLVADLDPIGIDRTIALGQAMGGCLSIVMQANHQTCDALGVLGFSAIHTVLPSPSGGVAVTPVERGRTDAKALAARAAEIGGLDVFAWAFHFEDEDPALVIADTEGGFPFREGRVPPWGSATVPPAAASMLGAGVVSDEAAMIDVPVFIGVGVRDVCPDPWIEPAAYRGATDITLCIARSMAHMHNFATTRAELWDRIHTWGIRV
jgi:pimeloyl-ACP methyl ester carboxylesterase